MPTSNTPNSFGTVTRTLHWLTALLILTVIPLGIIANGNAYEIRNGATDEALLNQTQLLFSLHKTIGIAIFFVALTRILWAFTQPKPAPLHPANRLETFIAGLVHWLLYTSLVMVPLMGWIHHASTNGFAPIWWPFGQSLPFVPKSTGLAETTATLHILFERILVISLLLHIAGALKHHVIDRDATLKRMWNGTPADGPVPHRFSANAPLAAAGIYAATVGVAAGMGQFSHEPRQSIALQETASDWTVTDGTLAISVTQLGSDVDGSFANWTAAIAYDPSVTEGEAGTVTTTIAIGSLTLGSVTAQAMGSDFFDQPAFPTATYTGTIIAGEDGLTSDGTLSIKDTTVPVSFPFTLALDGDIASMQGNVTVNRFDFGIGAGTDEGNLGPEVIIEMALTANR